MRRFSDKLHEWGLTLPSFLWLTFFFVIPTVIVVSIAFHAASPGGGIASGFTLETWRSISNPNYPVIVWRTIWISAMTTAVCVVLSLPCAYAIARMNFKWRAMVAGLIMLPFWTSFIVRVFAWRTLLNPEGFLQQLLISIGLATENTTLNYNSGAILVVSIYSFLPFAIMPIYSAAEKFDFSLLEAARDLGARSFYAFCRIFMPGIKRGIISAVLMVFIPAIGSYVIPDLVGGTDSELIGNKIYQRTFPDRNLPHASALATVTGFSVLFPLACVAWWLKRQDEREAKRLAEATARKLSGGAA
ncbi:MAG: ABC transporter permease [Kiritimatiellae bacterium]|jgi:spermidine/putrescine transport system permease protein|nr:ABC transporter permease [Kiritimatiellia bacterium]